MFQQRAFAESLGVEVRAFTIDIHFINTIGRLPQPVKQGRQSCITIEALLLRPASIHLFTFQYIPIHLFINIFQTIHEQQCVKPEHLIGDSQQCDSNPPIPNCNNSIWRHFFLHTSNLHPGQIQEKKWARVWKSSTIDIVVNLEFLLLRQQSSAISTLQIFII